MPASELRPIHGHQLKLPLQRKPVPRPGYLSFRDAERSPLAKAAVGLLAAVAKPIRGFKSFPLRQLFAALHS